MVVLVFGQPGVSVLLLVVPEHSQDIDFVTTRRHYMADKIVLGTVSSIKIVTMIFAQVCGLFYLSALTMG